MTSLSLPIPDGLGGILSPPVYLQTRSLLLGGCSVQYDDSSCTIIDSRPDFYRQVNVRGCTSADAAVTAAIAAWTDGQAREWGQA